MLDRVPQFVECFRYCDARKIVAGRIPLVEMQRLLELVSPNMVKQIQGSTDRIVTINFDFSVDELGNRFLKGQVKTDLLLTCQRCMDDMDYQVQLDLALGFIKDRNEEQEISGLYDSFYLENNEPIDFYALIEDEIILSLPLIAKHEDKSCLSHVIKNDDEIEKEFETAMEEKENPFAVLQQIKH